MCTVSMLVFRKCGKNAMRIMFDTNVLFSAFIISSPVLTRMIDVVTGQHIMVLPSCVID